MTDVDMEGEQYFTKRVKKDNQTNWVVVSICMIVFIVLGAVLKVFEPTDEERGVRESIRNAEQVRRDRAESQCVAKIKRGLKRPHTFGYGKRDLFIDELGDGSYRIVIYGEVTDGFGNRIRHARKCRIR